MGGVCEVLTKTDGQTDFLSEELISTEVEVNSCSDLVLWLICGGLHKSSCILDNSFSFLLHGRTALPVELASFHATRSCLLIQ